MDPLDRRPRRWHIPDWMEPRQLFFCVAGGVLLLAAVAGTLLAPRATPRAGEPPPPRGKMPPWAVALSGLALASFALAFDMSRLAVVLAAPFLLLWVLDGSRRHGPAPATLATDAAVAVLAPPPTPQAPMRPGGQSQLPARMQAELQAYLAAHPDRQPAPTATAIAAPAVPATPADFTIIEAPRARALRRPDADHEPSFLARLLGSAVSWLLFQEEPEWDADTDDGSAEFARRKAMDTLVATVCCALFAYGVFGLGRGAGEGGMWILVVFVPLALAAAVGPFVALWYAVLWLSRR